MQRHSGRHSFYSQQNMERGHHQQKIRCPWGMASSAYRQQHFMQHPTRRTAGTGIGVSHIEGQPRAGAVRRDKRRWMHAKLPLAREQLAWLPAVQVLHGAAHCGVAGGMYSGSTTGAGVMEGGVSERRSRSTRCGAPGAAAPPPHTSTLSSAAWDGVTRMCNCGL